MTGDDIQQLSDSELCRRLEQRGHHPTVAAEWVAMRGTPETDRSIARLLDRDEA